VPAPLLVDILSRAGVQAMTVEAGVEREGASRRLVTLPARPEPIRLAVEETAVLVIDMQNAYASPGGYLDLAGFDIGGANGVIGQSAKVLDVARAAGVPVIYFQNGWDEGYVEAGGPGSPNWHKSNALKTMRARPELQGKLLARGGWDYELVDGLSPRPGDIRLHKSRYSGFFNSQLDSVLRARGIRNIVLVGIATNVCVESTLRDGFFLEYFGIMLEDATHQAGPEFLQKATVYNVETFFGWVSTVADFCGAFGQIAGED
jgi:ureidoacrylate peracid hydrolase